MVTKIPYRQGYRKQFLTQFFTSFHCNPPPGHSDYTVLKIGTGFFGSGSTPAAAIRSAQEIITTIDPENVQEYAVDGDTHLGQYYVVPCSFRLSCAIIARGGAAAVPYTISADGVFDLAADQDREAA